MWFCCHFVVYILSAFSKFVTIYEKISKVSKSLYSCLKEFKKHNWKTLFPVIMLSGCSRSAGDVLQDIGSMLSDLTDELDAMLNMEGEQSDWGEWGEPGLLWWHCDNDTANHIQPLLSVMKRKPNLLKFWITMTALFSIFLSSWT